MRDIFAISFLFFRKFRAFKFSEEMFIKNVCHILSQNVVKCLILLIACL